MTIFRILGSRSVKSTGAQKTEFKSKYDELFQSVKNKVETAIKESLDSDLKGDIDVQKGKLIRELSKVSNYEQTEKEILDILGQENKGFVREQMETYLARLVTCKEAVKDLGNFESGNVQAATRAFESAENNTEKLQESIEAMIQSFSQNSSSPQKEQQASTSKQSKKEAKAAKKEEKAAKRKEEREAKEKEALKKLDEKESEQMLKALEAEKQVLMKALEAQEKAEASSVATQALLQATTTIRTEEKEAKKRAEEKEAAKIAERFRAATAEDIREMFGKKLKATQVNNWLGDPAQIDTARPPVPPKPEGLSAQALARKGTASAQGTETKETQPSVIDIGSVKQRAAVWGK